MVVVYTILIGYVVFHVIHHSGAITLTARPCPTPGQEITTTISQGIFSPSPVVVKRCDDVTIINRSNQLIELGLGPHHEHTHYPTFAENVLSPGKSMRFQASVLGSFELHDHIKDKITTTLTVTE